MKSSVTILCGVSGAGKSHFCCTETRADPTCRWVSADAYMVDDRGRYRFDPSRLEYAHNRCLRDFVQALQEGASHILVDNTNTCVQDVAPYAQLALAFEARLSCRVLLYDPFLAHRRQVHGVPLLVVLRQDARLRRFIEEAPGRWNLTVVPPPHHPRSQS